MSINEEDGGNGAGYYQITPHGERGEVNNARQLYQNRQPFYR